MINRIASAVITAVLLAAAWVAVTYWNADPDQLLLGAFAYVIYTTYRDAGRLDDIEKRHRESGE